MKTLFGQLVLGGLCVALATGCQKDNAGDDVQPQVQVAALQAGSTSYSPAGPVSISKFETQLRATFTLSDNEQIKGYSFELKPAFPAPAGGSCTQWQLAYSSPDTFTRKVVPFNLLVLGSTPNAATTPALCVSSEPGNGPYTLTIRCRDAAGNESTAYVVEVRVTN